MKSSFIVTPIKRIRSCPAELCSTKSFNESLQKEVAVGSLMAVATVMLSGHHHHLTTFKELESTLTYETINTLSVVHYDRESLISRLTKRKKKAVIMLILIPFLIRYLSYISVEVLI